MKKQRLERLRPQEVAFLRFLERDIEDHPERLRGFPEDLLQRLIAVTEGVEVDLDEPIEGLVAL
jgi:antitoxin PrlF